MTASSLKVCQVCVCGEGGGVLNVTIMSGKDATREEKSVKN